MSKLRTQFSAHANTIAETFRAAVAKTKVGEYAVGMTAPEETTHGGLLGLQHIVLTGASGASLVIGGVHAGERKADLKSFAQVARAHQERFKKPPPFTDADYAAFVARVKPIFTSFALEMRMTEDAFGPEEAASSPASTPSPAQSRMRIGAAAFLTFLVIAGGAALLLR